MLQDRRSLSVGSAHELGSSEITSSHSQVSVASEVHENIDIEEVEQTILEVQVLKKHITVYEGKI